MAPILINWRERTNALQDELNKAIAFIQYLDKNYSGYMSEEDKFEEWRGKYGKDKVQKVFTLQETN